MTLELEKIKGQFEELQEKYRRHMPKVDPALVDDLLLRQMESPGIVPIYLLEVFTKEGLDTEQVRSYIMSKTGMSPAIYDGGTHYVTNQKLTLDMLKEISDSDDVLEVTGEYTGGLGGYGASHERGHKTHQRTGMDPRPVLRAHRPVAEKVAEKKAGGYRMAAYAAVGIAAAIALAGFVISGGIVPNANGSSNSAAIAGTEPGVLHGYVSGPGGLPAIGATVLAFQQGTDFTASAFVSVSGQYSISLPPGEYIVVVAFPDGTDRIQDSQLVVARGTSYEQDISY